MTRLGRQRWPLSPWLAVVGHGRWSAWSFQRRGEEAAPPNTSAGGAAAAPPADRAEGLLEKRAGQPEGRPARAGIPCPLGQPAPCGGRVREQLVLSKASLQ